MMTTMELELIGALKEAVNALNFQIKDGQSKSWVDFIPIWISSSAPLLAVILSFFYFNKQHVQSAKAKIAEKDVERLYEAADLFFEYADSLDLFFAMTEIKFGFLNQHKGVPESIDNKAIDAAEAVYGKFRCIHKSEFLLRSLGEENMAKEVESYREETIEFRKKVIDISKWKSGEDYPSNLDDRLLKELQDKRTKFIKLRNNLLDKIAKCKENIKSTG
ncbi:hypothetical protein QNF12_004115 [Vibrio alginolyticus]|nr:hypothetical protein [Vibrio alginolyticus]ELB2924787.1 hypothetical protein [Vibrio alginolyticus]